MDIRRAIIAAIREERGLQQSNTSVTYWHDDKGYMHVDVDLFKTTIFTAMRNKKSAGWIEVAYDFGGYEGSPITCKRINACLEAVAAGFRVKTKNGQVIEEFVSEKPIKDIAYLKKVIVQECEYLSNACKQAKTDIHVIRALAKRLNGFIGDLTKED